MNVTQRLMPLLAALAIGVGTPALAATAAQDHDHGAPAKPTLNAGKKWATDQPLREGMTRIRAAVEPKLGDIHAGRVAPDQYAKIAGEVEAQMGYIVSNCKLDPKADAVLHGLLGEIGQGVEAMAGKEQGVKRETGAVKVVTALNQYGKYFDHPGWKPVRTGH